MRDGHGWLQRGRAEVEWGSTDAQVPGDFSVTVFENSRFVFHLSFV